MQVRHRLLILGALLVSTSGIPVASVMAEDASPQPQELGVFPKNFLLVGHRSRQQLVITAKTDPEKVLDYTDRVEYASSNTSVVRMEGAIALPCGDGKATISVSFENLRATATVEVTGYTQPDPVSFKNETLASLTKSSCNMGACHGSPSGKAGFRLSLRGFDPPLDILTLRSEFYGRRTNVMNPSESLILKKALMEVAHGGGRRMKKGEPAYSVMHQWIAEGLQLDSKDEPDLVRVEVFPSARILHQPGDRQQLQVSGFFSDGSIRDVTALTVFSSSNENVGTVSAEGLIEKIGRGETAILVRYLDKMSTSYVTFLEEIEGFAWNNPPVNNFVDELVYSKLNQLQILPSDVCTDSEFIRRAYLDLTGRLPRIEETMAFLTDDQSDKRTQLVDQLLDSDDFASFWALKWGDILRSNSKKLKTAGVHKFRRWIYDGIRNDKPIDQFAQELLTAQGSVYENPAANYWRASRDPNDAVETTAQLFLGIRIQCAKCHNHPFERWSQDNYYGIAAAFARVGRKNGPLADDEIIFQANGGEVKQPRTGETMKVHLLLEGDVDVPADQDRRVVFADWLTRPDNPFFARASVNRIWGHLMGRGIVEPVDDFRDSNPPSNAALLDRLSEEFVKNEFSRKWAIRTIMQSRTYQFSSRKNDFNADDEIYASHANTRLLSAEQLLDAICQVTDVAESFSGMPAGTRAVELPDPPANHYFLKVFGQPQREMACECERSNESNLSQALQMINGPVVHNKLRADNGRIVRMINEKKADEEIVDTLYLSALSRKAAEAEMKAAKNHLANSEDRRQALEDIGWAILNSKEFLFQH